MKAVEIDGKTIDEAIEKAVAILVYREISFILKSYRRELRDSSVCSAPKKQKSRPA